MHNLTRSYYNLMDPFFDDFFEESNHRNLMKTDIIDAGDHYEMNIEMPDVKKSDIHLSLENGYLTIQAKFNRKEAIREKHKVIRQERFSGSYERSFNVGQNITESDIKARLEDGVLTLLINKNQPESNTKRYITID